MMRRLHIDRGEEPYSKSPSEISYQFEIDPVAIARLMLRRRWLIFVVCALSVIATTAYMLAQPNLFTSSATILPAGNRDNYSPLKAFIGMASGFSIADDNSSALFPVVLRSNLVVDAVLSKRYEFEIEGESRALTLSEYFGIDNPDKLRKALRAATTINMDARTGEITLGAETRYGGLSQAVVSEYLAQLEEYNISKRRSRAGDNQSYLEGQLAQAQVELNNAEEALQQYRLSNLNWAGTTSPVILANLSRLQREVEVHSRAYLLLQEQYEMAKFEAQKDIPIVNVLDQPSLPTQKSGPFRRNVIILSGVVSLGLVVLGIFVFDLIQQGVSGPNRAAYAGLRDDLASTFPRLSKSVARIGSRLRSADVPVGQVMDPDG
jgi:uncharacterized protein involved in exopolysaccharide biosynthesis